MEQNTDWNENLEQWKNRRKSASTRNNGQYMETEIIMSDEQQTEDGVDNAFDEPEQVPTSPHRVAFVDKVIRVTSSGRGYGFELGVSGEDVVVERVMRGSPADVCDLRVADKVTHLANNDVRGLSVEACMDIVEQSAQAGFLTIAVRRLLDNEFTDDDLEERLLEAEWAASRRVVRVDSELASPMMTSSSAAWSDASDVPPPPLPGSMPPSRLKNINSPYLNDLRQQSVDSSVRVPEPTNEFQPASEPVVNDLQQPIEEPVAAFQPIREPLAAPEPIREPVAAFQSNIEPVAVSQPIREPVVASQPIREPLAAPELIREHVVAPQPIREPEEKSQPISDQQPVTSSLASDMANVTVRQKPVKDGGAAARQAIHELAREAGRRPGGGAASFPAREFFTAVEASVKAPSAPVARSQPATNRMSQNYQHHAQSQPAAVKPVNDNSQSSDDSQFQPRRPGDVKSFATRIDQGAYQESASSQPRRPVSLVDPTVNSQPTRRSPVTVDTSQLDDVIQQFLAETSDQSAARPPVKLWQDTFTSDNSPPAPQYTSSVKRDNQQQQRATVGSGYNRTSYAQSNTNRQQQDRFKPADTTHADTTAALTQDFHIVESYKVGDNKFEQSKYVAQPVSNIANVPQAVSNLASLPGYQQYTGPQSQGQPVQQVVPTVSRPVSSAASLQPVPKRPDADTSQHWLVVEAERRRLAEQAKTQDTANKTAINKTTSSSQENLTQDGDTRQQLTDDAEKFWAQRMIPSVAGDQGRDGFKASGQSGGYNASGQPGGYNASGQSGGYNASGHSGGYNSASTAGGSPGSPQLTRQSQRSTVYSPSSLATNAPRSTESYPVTDTRYQQTLSSAAYQPISTPYQPAAYKPTPPSGGNTPYQAAYSSGGNTPYQAAYSSGQPTRIQWSEDYLPTSYGPAPTASGPAGLQRTLPTDAPPPRVPPPSFAPSNTKPFRYEKCISCSMPIGQDDFAMLSPSAFIHTLCLFCAVCHRPLSGPPYNMASKTGGKAGLLCDTCAQAHR